MTRSILVTGITGEFGSVLAKVLPEGTFCFSRRSINLDRLKVLICDIVCKESIVMHSEELTNKIDTIVHLASTRGDRPSKSHYSTIYQGTMNLYDFACEIRCPKFLYFSSILADKRKGKFGKMKYKTENKLLRLSEDRFTKVLILRPGNIYGVTKLSFIRSIADMLKEKKKILYHRAKHKLVWSPIYIQDVIDCVFRLLAEKYFNNQIYYLTSAELLTLEHLTQIISELINIPIETLELNRLEKCYLKIRQAGGFLKPLTEYNYSNWKLERDFGFTPKVKVREGIPKTLQDIDVFKGG